MFYLIYIAAFSILIPAILSIKYYKNQKLSLRLLSWFIWICALLDLSNHILAELNINNTPSFHIYTIIEFAFLLLVLRQHIHEKFSTKIAGFVILNFSVLAIVNVLFFENLFRFNANMLTLESLLMIIAALFYFYQVLQSLKEENLLQSPMFWISAGILIYFSINLFIYTLGSYLIPKNFDWTWVIIHNMNYIARNVLFSIGIWNSRKQ